MTKTCSKPGKRKFIVIIAACGLAVALGSSAGFSETNKGPADMVLKTAKAKKPAIFPHAKHQETLECAQCHHARSADGGQAAYTEGQPIAQCISCHNKKDMSNSKLNNFKKAAHAKCKNCHAVLKKQGKPTGPVKCSGCHVKKK